MISLWLEIAELSKEIAGSCKEIVELRTIIAAASGHSYDYHLQISRKYCSCFQNGELNVPCSTLYRL